ncbi:hypothetical protein Tco_0051980 [Tanacetum coccineum]
MIRENDPLDKFGKPERENIPHFEDCYVLAVYRFWQGPRFGEAQLTGLGINQDKGKHRLISKGWQAAQDEKELRDRAKAMDSTKLGMGYAQGPTHWNGVIAVVGKGEAESKIRQTFQGVSQGWEGCLQTGTSLRVEQSPSYFPRV